MRGLGRFVVFAAAALGAHSVALACQLVCSVSPASVEIVEGAQVTYSVALVCPVPGNGDTVTVLDDTFAPIPTTLPFHVFNDPVTVTYARTIDYAACKAIPGAVTAGDGTVTAEYTVSGATYWLHDFWCGGSIVCRPPSTPGATRTLGFFKTHRGALEACIGAGVDLGFTTIGDVNQALALLWADPGKYSGADKARILLGRQALVAICNGRLFGSAPGDGAVLPDALSALATTNCGLMGQYYPLLDSFNNSNDSVELPAGASVGANTGKPSPIPALDSVNGAACGRY